MFRAVIYNEIIKVSPADVAFFVSASEQSEYGDYSSNAAMVVAKKERKNPKDCALEFKTKLEQRAEIIKNIERTEIAGPGFLNFYLKKEALWRGLENILSENSLTIRARGKDLLRAACSRLEFSSKVFLRAASKKPFFAKAMKGEAKRICLEFVSANPTGPLTMANGRGGFYGDALANILEAAGHNVTREYYINDTGNQIKLLGESILAAEENSPVGGFTKDEHYKGEYIKELKGKSAKQAATLLLKSIKASLKKAGIKFDIWFSEEKNLCQKGALKKTLKFLQDKKLVREYESALWLGDPKRDKAVLVKSDGEPTYFLADLAYHYDKFINREFDIAINIWGADHHGYAARMKRGAEALGIDANKIHILIMQLVRLISGGKEMRMSKRAGNFVTMDELLEMVGVDVARWFFLEKSLKTHMDFDLDLARERSRKNPVYYVQYAHARACSILKKSTQKTIWRPPARQLFGGDNQVKLKLLETNEELALIKKILQLPEIIEDIASDYEVQRLPRYAYELAKTFTDFYENCRVIYPEHSRVVDESARKLTAARLALVLATQKTLHAALGLMGISAPKKM